MLAFSASRERRPYGDGESQPVAKVHGSCMRAGSIVARWDLIAGTVRNAHAGRLTGHMPCATHPAMRAAFWLLGLALCVVATVAAAEEPFERGRIPHRDGSGHATIVE